MEDSFCRHSYCAHVISHSARWVPVRDRTFDALPESVHLFPSLGHFATRRCYGGVVDTSMLPWSGGVWRKSSMAAATMRAKTATKRTKVTGPPLSSRRLMPSFAFHRSLANLLRRKHKKRRGKNVTINSESLPFPEAGWDKDTEAFGYLLDYITYRKIGW